MHYWTFISRHFLLMTIVGAMALPACSDDGGNDVDTDTETDTDTGTGTGSDTSPDAGAPDEDGDGFDANEDCDDDNEDVYPGGDEKCNDVDDDCDGDTDEDAVDATTWYADADDDDHGDPDDSMVACESPSGYLEDNTDCNPNDGDHWVDCDDCVDNDGDGFGTNCDLGDDCDDSIATGAACNTGCTVFYSDSDDDGFGDSAGSMEACTMPVDYVANSTDCDPSDGNHWADCGNCVDNDTDDYGVGCDLGADCDDSTETGAACNTGCSTFWDDTDNDTFGDAATTISACIQPAGYVTNSTDCDPGDVAHWADCLTCVDNDGDDHGAGCDVGTDCDDSSATGTSCFAGCNTYYDDTDADNYGNPAVSVIACVLPAGYVLDNTDCAPGDIAHWADCLTCVDADGDDYGDACDQGGDCDDTVETGAGCHTGCSAYYADVDADTYGDGTVIASTCSQPAGYVNNSTDCDDDPTTGPACNVGCTTYYDDTDSDGFGDATGPLAACSQPADYVANSTDCDPASGAHWDDCGSCVDGDNDDYGDACDQGADCDDDAASGPTCHTGCATYYLDFDGDDWGDVAVPRVACVSPVGHVSDSTDCDDDDPLTYPDADEICDGKDNDCDLHEYELLVIAAGAGDATTIQGGIDALTNEDFICVTAGTYVENINLNGAEVHILGVEGPSNTILQGAAAGSAVVTFENSEDSDTVLEGLTISDGEVNYISYESGGIQIDGASPELRNLIVTDNKGTDGGGIAIINLSYPELYDVVVDDNEATAYGGGVYIYNSSPVFHDCTISNNKVEEVTYNTGMGGGVAVYDAASSPEFYNNQINGNYAHIGAGGVYSVGDLTMDNCVIMDNSTRLVDNNIYGGGIYIRGGTVSLTNMAIIENATYGAGGGICVSEGSSDVTITNAMIAGNSVADGVGGGLYSYLGDVELTNVSFTGNSADTIINNQGFGGAIFITHHSTVTLANVDISNNTAEVNGSGIGFQDATQGSVLNASYSNAWNNTGAGSFFYVAVGSEPDPFAGGNSYGNISENPNYLDTSGGTAMSWDIHLGSSSLLIDAGDPVILDPDTTTSNIGCYGGPGADNYDLDGDTFNEWWQPGPYNSVSYPALNLDCNDRDDGVTPASGC